MKKRLGYCATAVAISGSLLSVGAVSASAATQAISTGRIQLCSQGNYASAFQFQGDTFQGYQTNWISAGTCQTFNVPGDANHLTSIYVVGKYNTSSSQFSVPSPSQLYSNPVQSGRKIATKGTTAAGDHYWMELANV